MDDCFVLHIIPVLCGLSPCPVALDFPRPKRETQRESTGERLKDKRV